MPTPAAVWNWNDRDDATLRQLWRKDAMVREIAFIIGCTEHQVNRRRKQLGIAGRPVGWKSASTPVRGSAIAPTPPTCHGADAAFARAMAGRKFISLKVSADPRRLYTASRDAGLWASSIELNA